jgi:hypothetical protein
MASGKKGILSEMRCCVRRRESHGNDEIGGGESQQDQHERFAAPNAVLD